MPIMPNMPIMPIAYYAQYAHPQKHQWGRHPSRRGKESATPFTPMRDASPPFMLEF